MAPDIPDLTIKTRQTAVGRDFSATTEIVYLKGTRQRREWLHESGESTERVHRSTIIDLCDERRTIALNHEAKTYASWPMEDMTEHVNRARRGAVGRARPELTGANVRITIDSVDTGERRTLGRYVARRVRTTTSVAPDAGAMMRASVREQDGWYVDLPSSNCSDNTGWTAFLVGYAAPAGAHDRIRVEHRGTARRGYPIEETDRSQSDADTFTTRLELLEFSEAPIDPAMFTVPADYRRALPRLAGGHDLSKPDTLMNRIRDYHDAFTSWARQFFR